MNKPMLLREWIALDYKPSMVVESKEKNGGKIILQGIIQAADKLNQNKRVYPMEILRREIENYQKAVRENRAVGELDHPETSSVSLDRVSHVIREMWWDGNSVHGRIEVLNTPKGMILQSLLDSGITIGISSRGVGSTDKNTEGHDVVQPDYQIICFDIVSEPSTPGAYLFGESKEVQVNSVRYAKADRIYRALNDIVRK